MFIVSFYKFTIPNHVFELHVFIHPSNDTNLYVQLYVLIKVLVSGMVCLLLFVECVENRTGTSLYKETTNTKNISWFKKSFHGLLY